MMPAETTTTLDERSSLLGSATSWRDRTALPPLPATARILLLLSGWVLFFLGILGLVLPGLQGILTLLASAAVWSLVSPTVLGWLRRALRPWSRGWRRLLRLRRRIHSLIARG